jgi:hypothetical protein
MDNQEPDPIEAAERFLAFLEEDPGKRMRAARGRTGTPEDAIAEFFRPWLGLFQTQREFDIGMFALDAYVGLLRVERGDDYELHRTARDLQAVLNFVSKGPEFFSEIRADILKCCKAGGIEPEACEYILDRVRRVTEIRPARGRSNTSLRNEQIRLAVIHAGEEFRLKQADSIRLISAGLRILHIDLNEEVIRRDILPVAQSERRPKRQPKKPPKVGQI